MTDQRYRLLVIDIDGTLTNNYGDISAENRAALARARDAGVLVSLSTGRSRRSSLGIIRQLSLDSYHIFFDGALVSSPDGGSEIYAQPISGTVVRQMVEFARLHDIDLELHSTHDYFARRETWSTEARRRFFDTEPVIGELAGLWERERIIKGSLTVSSPEETARAESFAEHFADHLHFSHAKVLAFPDVTFVNILAPGTSKGKALEALAAQLGIPLAEVVAVGDGRNDVSLLSAAGLGIAMGNAHEEVKKVADHVTLHVKDDGLAVAIKRFLF